MAKITVLCVGGLKETYWTNACAEYEKRLRRYCDLQIIEIKESFSDDVIEESKRLLKKIPDHAFVVVCDVAGAAQDSLQWAAMVQEATEQNGKEIVFVIGGSNGIGPSVVSRAQKRVSFSKMTFPHQLFRVVLLEQLYRAFKIMKNEKYHK